MGGWTDQRRDLTPSLRVHTPPPWVFLHSVGASFPPMQHHDDPWPLSSPVLHDGALGQIYLDAE
jgi:hypothetical protein